jgi:hypothetical protein
MSAPRGLANSEARFERWAMLESVPSTQPLRAWREELLSRRSRREPDVSVPHFDPAEAGVAARVLVLLESRGPKADAGAGSGFVSVDNNDATAATAWRAV